MTLTFTKGTRVSPAGNITDPHFTLPLDQPIRSSIFWPNLDSSLLQALFLGSTDHFCFLRAGKKTAALLHNSHPAQYHIKYPENKLTASWPWRDHVNTHKRLLCRSKIRNTHVLSDMETKATTHRDQNQPLNTAVTLTLLYNPVSQSFQYTHLKPYSVPVDARPLKAVLLYQTIIISTHAQLEVCLG